MFFPKLRFLLASPVYIYKDIFLLCVVWPVESSVPEQVFLSAWSPPRSAGLHGWGQSGQLQSCRAYCFFRMDLAIGEHGLRVNIQNSERSRALV